MSGLDVVFLDKVKAKFKPKIVHTLVPEAKRFIDCVGIFQHTGEIEDGFYRGQNRFSVPDNWFYDSGGIIAWVPEEDLEFIEVVK